jgi:hypothetical protein
MGDMIFRTNIGLVRALKWRASLLLVASGFAFAANAQNSANEKLPSHTAGVEAFESILPVLRHPRCLVCHSTGDFPRQGDDLHRHIMDVRRGPSGDGAPPVYCSSCHQDHNLSGVHMPPGAPDWHLPSANHPMIWQGLSNRELCELLVDPKQNGGRDAHEIEEHMHTPLVLWGWHPGEGRNPVAMPEASFLRDVHTWTAAGAPCPSR